MYDLFTTTAITCELQQALTGGHIQLTGLSSRLSLLMEIYNDRRLHRLVVSPDPANPRLFLSEAPVAVDPELSTPFSQLVRKYCRGGVVLAVEQPELERIVRVRIGKQMNADNDSKDEGDGDVTATSFVIEIMGRHSNAMLLNDDDKILDSMRRVPPSMSRARPILPGRAYQPPPVGTRLDPRRIDGPVLQERIATDGQNAQLEQALTRTVRGMSPQSAKEAIFLALNDGSQEIEEVGSEDWGKLANVIRDLFGTLGQCDWQPTLYEREDGDLVAYSARPLAHRDGLPESLRAATSMSQAVAATISLDQAASEFRHAGRVARLSAEVNVARDRAAARLESIRQHSGSSEEVEKYRRWGEAIYGSMHAITAGQKSLDWNGESVPLSPDMSAKAQAEQYFERYRKLQSAGEMAPGRLRAAEIELAYLDQLLLQLSQVDHYGGYAALQAEWRSRRDASAGEQSPAKEKRSRSGGRISVRPVVDRAGNQLFIGRSGAQNDHVTFDLAADHDLWIHARGIPGAHVILRSSAGVHDDETIVRAAAVAAWYSGGRSSGKVDVDVTEVRFVRKIKGAPPGMVTFRQEKTLRVEPADESLFRDG